MYAGDYRNFPSYQRFLDSERNSYTDGGRLGLVLDRLTHPDEYNVNEFVKMLADRIESSGLCTTFTLSRDEMEVMTYRTDGKQMTVRVSMQELRTEQSTFSLAYRVSKMITAGWDRTAQMRESK